MVRRKYNILCPFGDRRSVMRTMLVVRRNLAAVCMAAALLLVFGCGKSDGSTAPTVQPPPPPPPPPPPAPPSISIRALGAISASMQSVYTGSRVWVTSSDGLVKDSANLAADGTATITGANVAKLKLGVSFKFDAIDTTKRTFALQVETRTQMELANGLNIALFPFSWKLYDGIYAGRVVSIPLAQAFNPSPDKGVPSSLYSCYWNVNGNPNAKCKMSSVPTGSLPFPVAIKQGQQAPSPGSSNGENWSFTEKVTDADSALFKLALDSLNKFFGKFEGFNLVRVANPSEVWVTNGVAYRVDSTFFVNGPNTVSSGHQADSLGNIYAGQVGFRWRSVIVIRLIIHEILHTLGFGHGQVPGIMTGIPGLATIDPSPEEVAFLHVLYKVRIVEKQLGIRPGSSILGSYPQLK